MRDKKADRDWFAHISHAWELNRHGFWQLFNSNQTKIQFSLINFLFQLLKLFTAVCNFAPIWVKILERIALSRRPPPKSLFFNQWTTHAL
jgi:hypothetical protein